MIEKITIYQKVKLVTNDYQHIGLNYGDEGIVIEIFSDRDFLVDFTKTEDYKNNDRGELILNTIFKDTELDPII